MPPQNQMPPTPSSSGPSFDPSSLAKNNKLVTTIKVFAIYGSIMWLINSIVTMVISSFGFSQFYSPFNIGILVYAIISGAIGFAIGGIIFYYIYDPIKNWVKRTSFLSRHIHNMFTFYWKPYLVCVIIGAIFSLLGMLSLGAAVGAYGGYGAVSVGGLFVGWIVGLIVNAGVYYWYAKTVSAKLEPLYPW